jgi:chaperonin GroEL (HSP60 family)
LPIILFQDTEESSRERKLAFEILAQAVRYPLIQIADNAGYSGQHVVEETARLEC